ncbi:unnamed protein product [Gongylonema pulchrum]|uniref:PDZ domain-containing protein n=1 Tax=Gongylonema pulchrum TaxID=637853 RepID=A0A183DTX5_9BILA|nr:unnamed protein product [Gongylonema pulchrum]
MNHLLSCSISTNDFIFAHVAGQKKQVTMVKSEPYVSYTFHKPLLFPALGLIITDNGVGKAFIKRIAAGTVTAKANPAIEVGDYIESINDESMVGRRHFDVARYLRTLPVGTTFTLRLVAPKRSGFNFISTYNKPNKALSASNANQTIRFKADGTIIVQISTVPNWTELFYAPVYSLYDPSDKQNIQYSGRYCLFDEFQFRLKEAPNNLLISKMNDIFNSYLGFHDDELAHTVCELAATSENVNDFMNTLKTVWHTSFKISNIAQLNRLINYLKE